MEDPSTLNLKPLWYASRKPLKELLRVPLKEPLKGYPETLHPQSYPERNPLGGTLDPKPGTLKGTL